MEATPLYKPCRGPSSGSIIGIRSNGTGMEGPLLDCTTTHLASWVPSRVWKNPILNVVFTSPMFRRTYSMPLSIGVPIAKVEVGEIPLSLPSLSNFILGKFFVVKEVVLDLKKWIFGEKETNHRRIKVEKVQKIGLSFEGKISLLIWFRICCLVLCLEGWNMLNSLSQIL